MVIGAAIRVYFNLRHAGRTLWWIPVRPPAASPRSRSGSDPPDTPPAGRDDGHVRAGPADRPAALRPCHSMHPTARFDDAPPGSCSTRRSRSPREAALIKTVAVDSHVMPLGNVTHMTDAERKLLGAWIDQGAKPVRREVVTDPGTWALCGRSDARDAIAWFRTPGHDSYWRYHRDQFLEILPPPGKRRSTSAAAKDGSHAT